MKDRIALAVADAETALNRAAIDALTAYADRLTSCDDPDAMAKLEAYRDDLQTWRDAALAAILANVRRIVPSYGEVLH